MGLDFRPACPLVRYTRFLTKGLQVHGEVLKWKLFRWDVLSHQLIKYLQVEAKVPKDQGLLACFTDLSPSPCAAWVQSPPAKCTHCTRLRATVARLHRRGASSHVSPSLKLPETSDGVYGILLARLSCDQGQEKQQEGGRSGEEGQCTYTYTYSAVTVAAAFGV